MKTIACLMLMALALAVASPSSGDKPPRAPGAGREAGTAPTDTGAAPKALQDELVGLEKRSWVAWQNRDGKFFQDFLSDDHVEVGPSGDRNKAAVVASVASPACHVDRYAVDGFVLTAFDANTALLTYRAEQSATCGTNAIPSPARASSLYVRRQGRWLNAFYQQTPIRARPTSQ